MNDEARELLVAAALGGHKQVMEQYHDPSAGEGECALGVLHLAMHAARPHALRCAREILMRLKCLPGLCERFALTPAECNEIIGRNDRGEDFLTIARKVGTGDEA